MRIRDHFAERRLFLLRLGIAASLVVVLLGVVVGRLYYLQCSRHRYYAGQSHADGRRIEPVSAVRGLIFDRTGRLLAGNRPSYSLVITPDETHNLQGTLARLHKLLPISASDLARFHARLSDVPAFRGVPLLLQMSPKEVARFAVNEQRFPGVHIRAGLTRYYPLGPAAAHVVGYVGSITRSELKHVDAVHYRGTEHFGKTGVELGYQKLLHGLPGVRAIEVAPDGRKLRQISSKPSRGGDDLYLTLDARLQQVAYQAMGRQSGAVVAMNPRTGAILAMVSTPSFNPGLFVNGIGEKAFRRLRANPRQPLFNRAIAGQYPPGSTIKPFMALAGLNYAGGRYIHPRFDPGWYKLPGHPKVYHNWNPHGFGHVDLHKAIELSDDVYFYSLAHDLGIDRIHAFLARFGLGRTTGVDLPGEHSGILPSRKWKRRARGQPWYPGDTLNAGIGQGYLSATPLQLAEAVSRIAMRGGGARPHILYAVRNPNTGKVTRMPIHHLPHIVDHGRHAWRRVISGMRAVIESPRGTAHQIAHGLSFPAAGKTGTSQLGAALPSDASNATESNLPRRLRDDALFICFAPVRHPKIAVAVLVEHGGYGAAAAAPVARKVINAWLGPDGLASSYDKALTRTGAGGRPVQTKRDSAGASPARGTS